MARRFKNASGETFEIEAEYVEWAVEYSIGDEDGFIIPCDDEEEARLYRATLDGQIVTRTVFESPWADAPDH